MKEKYKFYKFYDRLNQDDKKLIDTHLSTCERDIKDLTIVRKNITIENTSEGYISRTGIDHSGDWVVPSGVILNLYKANPVVLWQHKKDELPIAKATSIEIRPDGIHSEWQYAEHKNAIDIMNLVKGGFLSTLSIGFITLQSYQLGQTGYAEAKSQFGITSNPGRIITKWILLEFSIVVVPDQSAAVITRKSLSDINIAEEKAVEYGLKVVCEGGKCDIFEKNNEGASNETIEEPNEPTPEVEDPAEDSTPEEEILEIEIELPLEEDDEPTPEPEPEPEPIFLFNRLGKSLSAIEQKQIREGKLLWS